jgi:SPP1 gp7 family putative phage head morphogenesis protein
MTQGKGMVDIRTEIIPYSKAVFSSEESVVINHIGDTRVELVIGKDGSISKVEKVITQEYKNNIKAYSDMLSRNAVHQSMLKGRGEGDKAAGYEQWVYLAVNDPPRVRPGHLALTGNVYTYGTPESDDAEAVQEEPNCRCIKIPYFNDPKLDTPTSYFENEKEQAGLFWDDANSQWAFKP